MPTSRALVGLTPAFAALLFPAFVQIAFVQKAGAQDVSAQTVQAPTPPAEPHSYRLEAYRAPTPATLDGAPGLTTAATRALWESKRAVFIDVLPQAPRPTNLAPGTIWRDKPRNDIPTSVWLPDTGYGALAATTEAYFKAGLVAASHDDPEKTLVFYCLRDCWMSWNAAKRAKTLGYRHVLWYPGGTDAWSEAGPSARAAAASARTLSRAPTSQIVGARTPIDRAFAMAVDPGNRAAPAAAAGGET